MCVCVSGGIYVQVLTEVRGIGSPGAAVTGASKLPDVAAGT